MHLKSNTIWWFLFVCLLRLKCQIRLSFPNGFFFFLWQIWGSKTNLNIVTYRNLWSVQIQTKFLLVWLFLFDFYLPVFHLFATYHFIVYVYNSLQTLLWICKEYMIYKYNDSWQLSSAYYMLVSFLSILFILSQTLLKKKKPWRWVYCYPHFIPEGTEAERGHGLPKSQSW